MGCVESSVKLTYAKLVVKLWDVTHWEKLRYAAINAKVDIYNIKLTYKYVPGQKIKIYPPLPDPFMPIVPAPRHVSDQPIYHTIPLYIKCENGGCTNSATRTITITAGTNSLRAKTCEKCFEAKKRKMKWDLRCYRTRYL